VPPSDLGAPLERNRLLAALPGAGYAALARRLEAVRLQPKQVLFARGGPIDYVYFPRGAVASILVDASKDRLVEGGSVGNEGVVGLAASLDAGPAGEVAICRIPGEAARMEARAFRAACKRSARLREVLQRYTLALMGQMARTAGCNRVHPIEERLARWLLMTHDRVGADQFHMTQEFIAAMLGVRRPSVTVAAGILQQAGLIDYRRGHLHILDRARLEEAACEDYRRTEGLYEELFRSLDGIGQSE